MSANPSRAETPRALHDQAAEHLRVIRATMERSSSFTAIPGWGGVIIGGTAIVTAMLAAQKLATPAVWLRIWLADAVIAAIVEVIATAIKVRRAGVATQLAAARRFFISYFAPIIAAAMLTAVLARQGAYPALPAVWLLLYGASFISSGSFSVALIPSMGVVFMLLGALACVVDFATANVILGVGFGGVHIVFGSLIARRYGG